MDDIFFMKEAINQAKKAFENDEVPVGAVIVKDNEIIARACNETRSKKNSLKHAEIVCIERATNFLGNERLTGCELYVTKEPCSMCAGAIVNARIARVIIGAGDKKYGGCGGALLVCGNTILNHVPEIIFGVCEEESIDLLQTFFKQKRLLQRAK